MATLLGCPEGYTVELHTLQRVDTIPNPRWPGCLGPDQDEDCTPTIDVPLEAAVTYKLGNLDGVSFILWQRILRDVSEARIEIDLLESSPGCCALLDRIETMVSFVRIFRDTTLVWEGEVVQKIETIGSTTKTLMCRDVLDRLDRCVNTHRLFYEDPLPVTDIAFDVIQRNLLDPDFDDPVDSSLIMDQIVVVGDVENMIRYRKGAVVDTVLAILKNLAQSYGLDFYTLNRSIHLTRRVTRRDVTVARLTSDHFEGSMRVVANGLEGGTMAFATTQRQGDSEGDPDWPGITETFGRTGTRWGRLDVLRRVEDHNASESEVRRAAVNALYGRFPPPTEIRMPEQTMLAPSAPLSMEQLVPGIRVDVYAIEGLCSPIRQGMRITGVEVTWQPGREESAPSEQVAVSTSTLSDVTGAD